jgi:hypothetical protein
MFSFYEAEQSEEEYIFGSKAWHDEVMHRIKQNGVIYKKSW